MTVREMLERMGPGEFEEWRAFYLLEPFGPRRDNTHAAMIADMIGVCFGGLASNPGRFMHQFKPGRRKNSAADRRRAAQAMHAAIEARMRMLAPKPPANPVAPPMLP